MYLKDWIDEYDVYKKCEDEIREWVESSFVGLSIIFEPHIEIVRTDEKLDFSPKRCEQIVELVNIKIAEILKSHAEEIYIAERLTRIYKLHPRFKFFKDAQNIEELKKSPKFCRYLKELIF